MKAEIKIAKPIGKSDKQNSPIVKAKELNLSIDDVLSDNSVKGASCTYGGEEYSDGSYICINHVTHKCKNGSWIMINKNCD